MDEKKIDSDLYHTEHATEHVPDAGHLKQADAANLLVNPLQHLSKEELLADVEAFCQEKDMMDEIDVFRRGALLAQRPTEFEDIPELTEEDLGWLRKSAASKWAQPRLMYFSGQCC